VVNNYFYLLKIDSPFNLNPYSIIYRQFLTTTRLEKLNKPITKMKLVLCIALLASPFVVEGRILPGSAGAGNAVGLGSVGSSGGLGSTGFSGGAGGHADSGFSSGSAGHGSGGLFVGDAGSGGLSVGDAGSEVLSVGHAGSGFSGGFWPFSGHGFNQGMTLSHGGQSQLGDHGGHSQLGSFGGHSQFGGGSRSDRKLSSNVMNGKSLTVNA
jgi:hypothetical protein